jgi:hypothetical protein
MLICSIALSGGRVGAPLVEARHPDESPQPRSQVFEECTGGQAGRFQDQQVAVGVGGHDVEREQSILAHDMVTNRQE